MRIWSINLWRRIAAWSCFGIAAIGVGGWLAPHHDMIMHDEEIDAFAGFGKWGWWGFSAIAIGFALKAEGNLLRMDGWVRRSEPWGIGVAIIALLVSMIQFQEERSIQEEERKERELSQKRIESELRFRNWDVAHDESKPAQLRLRYAKRILQTEDLVNGLTLNCFPERVSGPCRKDEIHKEIFSTLPETPKRLEIRNSKFEKIKSICKNPFSRHQCGIRERILIESSEIKYSEISGINTIDFLIVNSNISELVMSKLFARRIYIANSNAENMIIGMSMGDTTRAMSIIGLKNIVNKSNREIFKLLDENIPTHVVLKHGKPNKKYEEMISKFEKNYIVYQIVLEKTNISGLKFTFDPESIFEKQKKVNKIGDNFKSKILTDVHYIDKAGMSVTRHTKKFSAHKSDHIQISIEKSWFFEGNPPSFDFKDGNFKVFRCKTYLREIMNKIGPVEFSRSYLPADNTAKFFDAPQAPAALFPGCERVQIKTTE